MKWTRYMLLMPVLLVQALSSCSLIDEPEDNSDEPVMASLAFSLSELAKPGTRMTNDVLQLSNIYRGMRDVMIIPFIVDDPGDGVQSDDSPKALAVEGLSEDHYEKTDSWFYYYDKCWFMRGTNAVLFYGRAIPAGGKANNGSIIADYPAGMAPANISFKLEQMHSGEGVPSGAQDVATYLTNIARASGWSTTTDSKLRAFYLNFTGQGNQENAVLAGSSTSVTAYVNALEAEIDKLPDSDIKTAILTAIGTPSLDPYPVANTLPDGAAALMWNSEAVVDGVKGAFVPQTITTTEAAINSITRFTYPAELYYFANSQLFTSHEELAKTFYYSTETSSWEDVLNRYPGRSPVSGNTQAVAMKDPVQYAVARLKMTLAEPVGIILKDAKDQTVTYKDGTGVKLPLTGIIIGGQHQVGYNFKPQGTQSDVDMRFIYDSKVSGLVANTMVLQSYDGEKVRVILEFKNNTGSAFVGKDGIIYPGTKFYLIGEEIDPASKSGSTPQYGRVFTQDYTTEVTMQFNANSLKNAYNVMPDLLSPRLEVGVQLDKWTQTYPTTVTLD